MLYAIAALLVVIADQAVKYWVAGHIAVNEGIVKLIPGILSIVNIHNDGAAFSFLSGGGARIWFILICGVFTVLVIIALATNMISGSLGRWSAVLVAAGGIGNCLDRILYGYVQDMFMVEFVNFAVFNVADIFITVFCIVFILYVIFGVRDTDDDEDEDEDEEEEEEVVEEVKPRRKSRRAAREELPEAAAVEEAPRKAVEEEAPRARRAARAAVEEEAPRARRAAREAVEEEAPRARRAGRAEVEEEAPRARRAARVSAEEKPSRVSTRRAAEEAAPTVTNSRKAKQARYEDEYEQYKAAKAQRQRQQEAEKTIVRRAEPVVDSKDPFAEWENANARVRNDRQQAAAVNAAPAAKPAARPAAKPAAPAGDDFLLDDILNEFK